MKKLGSYNWLTQRGLLQAASSEMTSSGTGRSPYRVAKFFEKHEKYAANLIKEKTLLADYITQDQKNHDPVDLGS